MRFTQAFLLNLAGREITLLFSVLSTVVLARCLGTEGMGTYALVVAAAYLIAQAGALGFQYSNTFLAAREPETAGLLVTQSVLPVVLLAALVGPVMLWVPRITDVVFSDLPDRLRVIAWGGTGLIILNLNLGAIFAGLRRYKRFNVVNSLATVGAAMSNVVLVGLCGWRMPTPLYVWLAWNGLGVLCGLALVAPLAPPILKLDLSLLRRSVAVGGRAMVATVMTFVGFRGILLLINRDLGRALLGCYSIAVPVAELIMHIPATLGTILFNDAAAGEGGAPHTARILRLHLILSGFVGAGLVLGAPWLLNVLFGEKYVASVLPLRILLPGYYFWGIWTLTSGYVSGQRGYPGSVVALSALSGILTLGLAYFWIPAHALAGAAGAWSISSGVVALIMTAVFLVGARGQVTPGDLVPTYSDLREGWKGLRARPKSVQE